MLFIKEDIMNEKKITPKLPSLDIEDRLIEKTTRSTFTLSKECVAALKWLNEESNWTVKQIFENQVYIEQVHSSD